MHLQVRGRDDPSRFDAFFPPSARRITFFACTKKVIKEMHPLLRRPLAAQAGPRTLARARGRAYSPSWLIAHSAGHSWPAAPCARANVRRLQRGIKIKSEATSKAAEGGLRFANPPCSG